MLVMPASSAVLAAAVADGTLASCWQPGATIGTPGCGPCIGRHLGVLGAGEVCLPPATATSAGAWARPRRMIYLASPEAAAATALTGHITDPQMLIRSASDNG